MNLQENGKCHIRHIRLNIEGDFVSSAFVEEQIGVGNVCERSASAASAGGEKLVGKTAGNGITVAIYRVAHKNKE